MLTEENLFINGLITITDKEFNKISKLIYEKFGINLTDKKKSLVAGRLNKLIKNLGLKTFEEYYNLVINDNTNTSLLSLVDRISTNHTFFYREKDHFEYMKSKALPEISKRLERENNKVLRIWCAGSATGEEAYTIAMIVNEFFGYELENWDIGILATDISITALEKANQGIYTLEKIKELPIAYKNKYLKKHDKQDVVISERLKNLILFKRLNLMNDSFPFRGKFHIIFCRNVMIYFDKETREQLINRLCKYLYDGGYLFVGHSESIDRKVSPLVYLQPAAYQKFERAVSNGYQEHKNGK